MKGQLALMRHKRSGGKFGAIFHEGKIANTLSGHRAPSIWPWGNQILGLGLHKTSFPSWSSVAPREAIWSKGAARKKSCGNFKREPRVEVGEFLETRGTCSSMRGSLGGSQSP